MKRLEVLRGRQWMLPLLPCATLCWLASFSSTADAAPLILNEYNAVAATKYLAGGQYIDDQTKEDTYFKPILDLDDDDLLNGSNNGRIEGNGGNWIELVVVEDHLNVQGWELRWAETNTTGADGTDYWYGNGDVEQGIITFSSTAPLWANLRSGTIITLSEKPTLYVDTDWNTPAHDDDRNLTDGLDENDPEVDVQIDLSTDTDFDPAAGDFWLHVCTRQEQGQASPLVTTVTNVDGDSPGDFSVGPDDWELTVVGTLTQHTYGPIGEGIADFGNFPGNINDEEAGRLEAHPDQTGLNNDRYDDVTSTTFGSENEWGGVHQDFGGLRAWVPEPGTIVLLATGALALLLTWRRRR